MSSQLSPSSGCCSQCGTPPATTNIPGPQGAAGHNAFSTTTASFTVPASGSTVVINLLDSVFVVVGQALYIAGAGYYQVTALGVGGNITVKNLGVTGNTAQGTNISSPSAVTPAGAQGNPGTFNSISPTTTKGDLIVDNGAGGGSASDVRFPAGTNNYLLHADSTQTNGLQYRQIDLSGSATSLTGVLPISLGGTGQATQQASLNALMPNLPVAGDLVYYNGTNWVRFAIPTTANQIANKVLRVNAAGTAPEWAYQGIIQRLAQNYLTASSTANGITLGNSAPTASNGKLLMTQAITPVSTATKILVSATVVLETAAGGAFVALFNGSTCVAVVSTQAASLLQTLSLEYEVAPGSLTPITFNVYAGNIGASGTVYINSTSGFTGGIFGNLSTSSLVVEEHG